MTSNRGKLVEAQHRFSPLGYDVRALIINGEPPQVDEPQCDSLEQVADSKMEQGRRILQNLGRSSEALIVEDSGLFIETLGGFPGVYSAYVLDTVGCEGILRLMDAVDDRGAAFRAAACLWDGERVHTASGGCPGVLADAIRGSHGFGFDPIFIPHDLDESGQPLQDGSAGASSTGGLTFGEVDLSVKEGFSHRRRALDGLLDSLLG